MRSQILPVEGIGEVRPGDDLAAAARRRRPPTCADGDVVVVTQKVVSKAEGQLVPIDPDDPAQQGQHRRAASRCGSCAAGAT